MTPWNLLDIHTALRASWAADTCTPSDVTGIAWQPGNPAWGHCDITALIVNDIFGGDLVSGRSTAPVSRKAFTGGTGCPTVWNST